MAVTAAIKFTQGASDPDAGLALIGVLTTAVVVTNGNDAGVVYWMWRVIDVPPGSAVATGVWTEGGTSSISFSPDVRGSYLIELIVRDGGANQARDVRAFAVLETTGRLIPPFAAGADALNFGGQERGWATYLEEYLHQVDSTVLNVLDEGVSAGSRSKVNFIGASVTAVDNPGAGRIDVTIAGGTGIDPVAKAVIRTNVTRSGIPSTTLADGLTLAANDVVLLVGQSTASQNGLYILAAGDWSTARTGYVAGDNAAGVRVWVDLGNRNAKTRWECRSASGSAVVGTNSLSWFCISSPTGWFNLFDIDCTTGGLQTLSADGAYTYNGIVLTKFNTAGEAAAATIGDANGLYFQPAATKIFSAATRTLPGALIDPLTYYPNLTLNSTVRLYLKMLSVTGTQSGDGWVAGLDGSSAGVPYWAKLARTGCGGANEGIYLRFISSSGNRFEGGVRQLPVTTGAYPIHMIEMEPWSPRISTFCWSSGTWSGDWPAEPTMSGSTGYSEVATTTQTGNFDGYLGSTQLLFAAARSAGSASVVKYSNIRCDVKI